MVERFFGSAEKLTINIIRSEPIFGISKIIYINWVTTILEFNRISIKFSTNYQKLKGSKFSMNLKEVFSQKKNWNEFLEKSIKSFFLSIIVTQ